MSHSIDNGLSPGRRQAIIWTNDGILLIGPLGTNFSEIISKIHTFLFKKMLLKTSSAKGRPFCLGLNVLNEKNKCGIKPSTEAYHTEWDGVVGGGWWVVVTKPISSVPSFFHFPLLSKQKLAFEYHIYIWQVSPHRSYGDTCQIWMWFEESNGCFCKIENFAYGEISERSFGNPHPICEGTYMSFQTALLWFWLLIILC